MVSLGGDIVVRETEHHGINHARVPLITYWGTWFDGQEENFDPRKLEVPQHEVVKLVLCLVSETSHIADLRVMVGLGSAAIALEVYIDRGLALIGCLRSRACSLAGTRPAARPRSNAGMSLMITSSSNGIVSKLWKRRGQRRSQMLVRDATRRITIYRGGWGHSASASYLGTEPYQATGLFVRSRTTNRGHIYRLPRQILTALPTMVLATDLEIVGRNWRAQSGGRGEGSEVEAHSRLHGGPLG